MIHQLNKILVIITVLFFVVSCSNKNIVVPPVTPLPTGEYHQGKVVWHDLLTNDVEAVKSFYGNLFGWKFSNSTDPNGLYTTIHYNDEPIGGIVKLEQTEQNVNYASQWMEYISTQNVDAVIETARNNNCIIYREPFDIMNRGRIAIFADPRGALIAVVHSATGDPKDTEPDYNNWLWNELLTDDLDSSVKFYSELFGYETEKFKTQTGEDYLVLRDTEKRRAGVVPLPFEDVKPNWLPFIAVKDPSVIEKQVEKLGGTIILGTESVAGKNSVVISDPSGAVFAVTKWPLPKEIMEKLNEKN